MFWYVISRLINIILNEVLQFSKCEGKILGPIRCSLPSLSIIKVGKEISKHYNYKNLFLIIDCQGTCIMSYLLLKILFDNLNQTYILYSYPCSTISVKTFVSFFSNFGVWSNHQSCLTTCQCLLQPLCYINQYLIILVKFNILDCVYVYLFKRKKMSNVAALKVNCDMSNPVSSSLNNG